MNTWFQSVGAVIVVAGFLVNNASAEVGVAFGRAFRTKTEFASSTPTAVGGPGAAVAGIDHFYDDGFNRVDSSGNAGGLTSFWGYDNPAQYDPAGDGGNGTITMTGSQSLLGTASGGAGSLDREHSLMVYWQKEFSNDPTDDCTWGLRAALRWQDITVAQRGTLATQEQTLEDVYSLGGVIPPAAPFSGSYTGPNALISDAPVRTITGTTAGTLGIRREIDGNLYALDLGPTLSVDLTDKLRLVGRAGATVGWTKGRFAFRDGATDSGAHSKSEWLFGAHAGADLQFQVKERWGCFAGLAYMVLDDVQFKAEGHTADLEFGRTSFMLGIYYQ